MHSRKKIINELRFQLDSKEVKDQYYSVQLSASDANAILALLQEQDSCENCAIAIEDRQLVVRCKDCVKRPDEHETELNGKLYRYCELHRRWTTDDWFCADGKRR